MLVLCRGAGEKILVGDNIVVTVTKIRQGKAWIAIHAPKEISVDRPEVRERRLNETSGGDL